MTTPIKETRYTDNKTDSFRISPTRVLLVAIAVIGALAGTAFIPEIPEALKYACLIAAGGIGGGTLLRISVAFYLRNRTSTAHPTPSSAINDTMEKRKAARMAIPIETLLTEIANLTSTEGRSNEYKIALIETQGLHITHVLSHTVGETSPSYYTVIFNCETKKRIVFWERPCIKKSFEERYLKNRVVFALQQALSPPDVLTLIEQ